MKFRALGLVVLASLAVACSEKKDDPAPSTKVAPAVKEDGTTPANFACVGLGNPFVGGSQGTLPLQMIQQPVSGAPPFEGDVTVHWIDADDGVSVLGSSAPSDTTGCADMPPSLPCGATSLELELNALVAMHLESASPDLVPTYYYNYLTPAVVPPPTEPLFLLVIPKTVRDVFIGFLGELPSSFAGLGLGAGQVVDCDGDLVKNAIVEMPEATLIGYFAGGTPNGDATATDVDGRFVVAGIPPTSSPIRVNVKVYTGTEAEGEPESLVAVADARSYADSVSLFVALPKPD